jgi:hypothetical protein
MKFKSPLLSQASGSLAGNTFSRNKGGMYIRARATPTNPNSTFQAAVRALMSQLSTVWSSVMTQVQRDAWDLYAANTPLVDTLGESRPVTGLNMFTRFNVPALQSGLIATAKLAAPAIFNLGDYTAPAIDDINVGDQEIDISFDNTDDWAKAAGNALLIYVSRPMNPSINFFKGPYRYAGKVVGAATAPTSPASIPLPFVVAAGQKLFIKASVARSDGRMSSPFRDGQLA